MRRSNLSKHLHGLFIFACVICLFAVFPLPANGATASGGVWTATGSLNVARSYHTATLLNSGEVLVVGGADAGGTSLSSCELYDPPSRTWTETGSLLAARQFHTATLLPSGMVLVAGGVDASGNALNSCELYDPSSGTWSETGNFGLWRSNHTATLLPSGMVLLAGGFDLFDEATSSCELYDPSTGVWTATGSLITARGSHTATLLNNGDVLAVAGLGAPPNSLSTCELYDPSTGAWTATASLPIAITYNTATLLANGDVLVAGGEDVGGQVGAESVFPKRGDLLVPGVGDLTAGHRVPALDEIVDAYIYAMEKGKTVFNSSVPAPLLSQISQANIPFEIREKETTHQDQTVSPGTLVLLSGGYNNSGILSACQIYDSSTGKWTLTGSLANARYAFTTTLLNSGKVLAAGGGTATGTVLSSAELFTLSSTSATAPGAPTGVSATAGNADATVSFTAPASNGGSPITGYTVTSSHGGKTASGAGSPITVKGLTNGTAYTFTVTAKNKVGTGPASSPSSPPVTPATVPGTPTAVTAAVTASNAEATVSFKLPTNGGSPITVCTATSKPGGITGTGAGSPITVSPLTFGTAYTFTVTATNGVGTGKAASPSKSVTPYTVPGAPTIGTAKAGNADATVSFTAPASNGGSSITSYTVTSSAGQTAKGPKSPITVKDLTNGDSYTFTVTATNKAGTGMASGASNSVMPAK